MNRLVSGIQPTGSLHLGNYLGSIKNWVKLQEDYECFFFMADLHAITVRQNPADLHKSILQTAAAYVACGIDPNKSVIFQQSAISEHAELAWILNCNAQIGWLNRMTQFKDKAGKNKEKASLGLYAYPVLMAADILLYRPEIVPVGADQKQHIELARDIALSFNRNYETDFFTLPEDRINAHTQRIMSLRNGTKKMSKSEESDMSRINLTDSNDDVAKKIKKAKTDSIAEVTFDEENRPEVSNLLKIYSAISNEKIENVIESFSGKMMGEFKNTLAEILINEISPIAKKIHELTEDSNGLQNILNANAEKARIIARTHIKEIKKIVGLT